MSDQPYSDLALKATAHELCDFGEYPWARQVMDAAYDESPGLDRSVCARTFLNEIAEKLRSKAQYSSNAHEAFGFPEAADFLLREFGEQS